MPRGDKTGPMGEGPRSGRGKGFCSGSDQPGYMDTETAGRGMGQGGRGLGRGAGRGMGQGQGGGRGSGRGLGRGWRNNAQTESSYEEVEDKETLVNKARQLEAELAAVKNKLTDLESE